MKINKLNNLPVDVIEVIANPTLVGDEANLEGLQVGKTKYKVGTNNPLYLHVIKQYYKKSSAANNCCNQLVVCVSELASYSNTTQFIADTTKTMLLVQASGFFKNSDTDVAFYNSVNCSVGTMPSANYGNLIYDKEIRWNGTTFNINNRDTHKTSLQLFGDNPDLSQTVDTVIQIR